jgi:8-oxo-dGTP pyrophosphatase MutT (NUDIX family)
MLDFDLNRSGVTPRDAATLVVVRDGAAGVEVFCVERHPKSGFLGGAIVFPGGKVDPDDGSAEWDALVVGDMTEDRAQRIAACREALEEAAILPVVGEAPSHAALLDAQARAASRERSLRSFLVEHGLRLDLAALHPFARWVTPAAETRRFDTRFYLTLLPRGQQGAHDNRETTSSFWATAADVLKRFDEGRVQLLPPTHRTLEILARAATTGDAIALASRMCKDPICPSLVPQDGTLALVLPGDPAHDVREPRVPGRSRFVLRGDRWLPEDAPPSAPPGTP